MLINCLLHLFFLFWGYTSRLLWMRRGSGGDHHLIKHTIQHIPEHSEVHHCALSITWTQRTHVMRKAGTKYCVNRPQGTTQMPMGTKEAFCRENKSYWIWSKGGRHAPGTEGRRLAQRNSVCKGVGGRRGPGCSQRKAILCCYQIGDTKSLITG
jgi:hypothetical protein